MITLFNKSGNIVTLDRVKIRANKYHTFDTIHDKARLNMLIQKNVLCIIDTPYTSSSMSETVTEQSDGTAKRNKANKNILHS